MSRNLDILPDRPRLQGQGPQCRGIGPRGQSRYLAEIANVRDDNTGAGEKPIQIARKNLRFLAENESREGSSVLRVANVEKTETGAFRLNPRFVPPLLEIHANDYLRGIVNGILEILSAKSTQLSGGRRQKNQSLADFTTADIANFWLLYTVIRTFPCLAICFKASAATPRSCLRRSPHWVLRSPPSRNDSPARSAALRSRRSEQVLHRTR